MLLLSMLCFERDSLSCHYAGGVFQRVGSVAMMLIMKCYALCRGGAVGSKGRRRHHRNLRPPSTAFPKTGTTDEKPCRPQLPALSPLPVRAAPTFTN